MAIFREYSDPRLAALYDTVNRFGADLIFFCDLPATLAASSVIDLGCGTGVIACELARRGYTVTGVDPTPAMLAVARARAGHRAVCWRLGDASVLGEEQADLVLMTSHVAQVINDDESWRATLAAVHRALAPGGHVAFDSRRPGDRAWTRWTPERTRRRCHDPRQGPLEVWYELVEVDGDLVRSEIHYRFDSTGEELVSVTELRFRTEATLRRTLTDAGFVVEQVFGDWDRHPVAEHSPELIFVARRH